MFARDSNLKHLMEGLDNDTKSAIEWFENNFVKLKESKCHLLVAGHKCESLWANIGETRIWESKNENLLGSTIDRNLNFDVHVFTCAKKLAENCQLCLEFQITWVLKKKK